MRFCPGSCVLIGRVSKTPFGSCSGRGGGTACTRLPSPRRPVLLNVAGDGGRIGRETPLAAAASEPPGVGAGGRKPCMPLSRLAYELKSTHRARLRCTARGSDT
eukprot:scaffold21865_cov125-Isochrysis_galbana.AAC.1